MKRRIDRRVFEKVDSFRRAAICLLCGRRFFVKNGRSRYCEECRKRARR